MTSDQKPLSDRDWAVRLEKVAAVFALVSNPLVGLPLWLEQRWLNSPHGRALVEGTTNPLEDPRYCETIIRWATEQLQAYPENAWLHGCRAAAYMNRGEYQPAVADCTKAIRLEPSFAWAYVRRANCLVQGGDATRGLRDLNEALSLDPNVEDAYAFRGYAYLLQKEYNLAIVDYDEALRRDPANAWAHHGRGKAYLQMGEDEKALEDFKEAIRLNPAFTDAVMRALQGRSLSFS